MIRPNPRALQRVCFYLLSVSAIFVVGLCAWPYTVDDAYIVARYAVHVSRAQGYSFNPGPATDGLTGPAWIVPGLLALRAGLDPVQIAKLFGLACCALAAVLHLHEQRARARGTVAAWLMLLILACQPSFAGNGTTGLETGAAALAVCIATNATLARPMPRLWWLGASIAGLCWLRPELTPVSVLLLIVVSSRVGFWRSLPAWGLAVAGAAGVCAFRWWLTGSIVPLAFRAKAGSLRDGLAYVARAWPVITGGFGALLAVAGARFGQRRDGVRAAVLLVHTSSVILAGGDWMPGFRLFAPVLPEYAQLAAIGTERMLRRGRTSCVLALVALAFACGVPLVDLALRIPEWRAARASREQVGARIAADLRARGERVALVDIGYLGYASEREVVDLAGITDPAVARMPGGHLDKHIPTHWLRNRAPDLLLLHSASPPMAAADGRLLGLRGYPVEMRIARSAWVAREFRVVALYAYAPGYNYALLQRRPPAKPRAPETPARP